MSLRATPAEAWLFQSSRLPRVGFCLLLFLIAQAGSITGDREPGVRYHGVNSFGPRVHDECQVQRIFNSNRGLNGLLVLVGYSIRCPTAVEHPLITKLSLVSKISL
jgi:hypothetical protein